MRGPRIKAVSQRSSKIEPHAHGPVYKELSQHKGTLSAVSFLTISSCSHFETKCINKMSGSEEDLSFPGRGKRCHGHLLMSDISKNWEEDSLSKIIISYISSWDYRMSNNGQNSLVNLHTMPLVFSCWK